MKLTESAIKDHRVRKLADKNIVAQRKEIKEMEWLIDDIRVNGIAIITLHVPALKPFGYPFNDRKADS